MTMTESLKNVSRKILADRALEEYYAAQTHLIAATAVVEAAIEAFLYDAEPADLCEDDAIIVGFTEGPMKCFYEGTWKHVPGSTMSHYGVDWGIELRHLTSKGKPRKQVTRYSGLWIFRHYKKVKP